MVGKPLVGLVIFVTNPSSFRTKQLLRKLGGKTSIKLFRFLPLPVGAGTRPEAASAIPVFDHSSSFSDGTWVTTLMTILLARQEYLYPLLDVSMLLEPRSPLPSKLRHVIPALNSLPSMLLVQGVEGLLQARPSGVDGSVSPEGPFVELKQLGSKVGVVDL